MSIPNQRHLHLQGSTICLVQFKGSNTADVHIRGKASRAQNLILRPNLVLSALHRLTFHSCGINNEITENRTHIIYLFTYLILYNDLVWNNVIHWIKYNIKLQQN